MVSQFCSLLCSLPYNYQHNQPNNLIEFFTVFQDLADAMRRNPNLRVYVAHGYFDFVTPYYGAEYVISHMGLDPSLRRNVVMKNYFGGHSMYTEKATLKEMSSDVGEFIRTTTPAKRPTPSVQ